MTPERWQQMKDLLNQALELPAGERTRFLSERSADAELRREVEDLLALDEEVGDFIEQPAFAAGGGEGSGDRAGQRVGPYRLVEEIGRGGMGTVYRARRADDTFDKTVALKILKRGLDTEEVVRRFRAERQILAGLEHPNIARLLDGGTTEDGLPYLVMEHVDGLPIDVYCREEDLSVGERLSLFLQVCSAVQLAHRNLVVHRDLKPSNILVTPEGVPKLLDFGIAKLLDPAQGDGLMTVAGWQFLTPEYASPEQTIGAPVTTATDVYSLGVLLYQLLADRRPYDIGERTLSGLARALEAGDPPRPSAVAPPDRAGRLRGDLDNIALTALRHEPERRYGTVEQLADDLLRHRQGLPVRATPDTLRYRTGKFIRRNRVAVTAAAAFLVLVVGFSVVTWVFAQQAVASQQLAEDNAAKAERSSQISEAISGYLSNLIEGAEPDNSRGGELTVREIFDQAREELANDTELANQPEVKAGVLTLIGRAYLSLGKNVIAREVFEEALELQTELVGRDSVEVAELLNLIATSYKQEREFDHALELLQELLPILQRLRPPDDQLILQARSNLAALYTEIDEDDLAEREYRRLIPLWRTNGDTTELAVSLHNYGHLLVDQGAYTAAIPRLEEALELRENQPRPIKSRIAATVNVLGAAMEGAGRYAEAVALYERRVQIDRELYADPHPMAVNGLNNLGLAYQATGRLQEAEDTLLEARALLDQLNVSERNRLILLRNLASVRIDLGDLRQAELDLARPLSRFEKDEVQGIFTRTILGSLRGRQGRYAEAEELLVGAHTGLLNDPSIRSTHRYVQETCRRMARLYEAWGRPAPASTCPEARSSVPAVASNS